MVVNYIANTMTFAYRSIMGKYVRHIMSRYNTTHHELWCTPMSAIKHKCKEMWNINVNAKMICELVEMTDCNNETEEECNAMISYLSTI